MGFPLAEVLGGFCCNGKNQRIVSTPPPINCLYLTSPPPYNPHGHGGFSGPVICRFYQYCEGGLGRQEIKLCGNENSSQTHIHESPGLEARELSFLPGLAGLRESCVRTGLLACSLEHGAMTSHLIQSEWAGHPIRLLLFLKIYIYWAWCWAR